jgi:alpha-D-xyloside xylohydrolase
MRKMLNLRYRLLPYIYSEAYKVTKNGSTMMRPLVMDFPEDTTAIRQPYQYMFGNAFLVAPVTEPGVKEWEIYLPKEAEWYDFRTGEKYTGGQTVNKETPLDIIPLFVKAGSIVPFGPEVQFATEKKWDNLEIRVYEGANGEFTLYEDENDNYNYEGGICSTINFSWDDSKRKLIIGDSQGSFPGDLKERKFSIVVVKKNKGGGDFSPEQYDKVVTYTGKKSVIKL